jgi:hypothetical protein
MISDSIVVIVTVVMMEMLMFDFLASLGHWLVDLNLLLYHFFLLDDCGFVVVMHIFH